MSRVRNEILKKYIEYWNLSKMIGWSFILILTHKKEKNQIMNQIRTFLKLMSNTVYDQTMENLRKRIKIKVNKNK